MKRLFIFTYPKLTLFVLAIIAAYFVFQIPAVLGVIHSLNSMYYLPVFFAGLLFSAGFSTPIAMGFFLTLDPTNIYLSAFIGGLGALIADLGIFSFVRLSFTNEFKLLKKGSFIKHISSIVESIVPKRLRKFLVYVIVMFVIISPLPDELGVALLAGFTKVHSYAFMAMSYFGNALGIYLLLLI